MALHNKVLQRKAAADAVSYKTFSFATKSPTIEGRTVCGYLAAFGNVDSDNDLLVKGCFAKSLNDRGVTSTGGNKIAHLWQHKMDMPLGQYKVLKEDEYGLYFEAEYDDIQKANDALVQFKSGTLSNFSIGYSYVWDKCEWDNTQDCLIVKEVNLYEGSVVTLAANDKAMYIGMKSEQKANEIAILTEEYNEAITGLPARKKYELGQIFDKIKALAGNEPPDAKREALKTESQPPKKSKFAKLSKLN
jgi:HK97 family phage prohead protease